MLSEKGGLDEEDVQVRKNTYSVPSRLIGQKVEAKVVTVHQSQLAVPG